MENNIRIHITPPHIYAENKIGNQVHVYFCAIRNKVFDTVEHANQYCKSCDCGCDRGAYIRQKQYNTPGLHMKAVSGDALIKIEGHFMHLDESEIIKREIIEDGQPEI